MPAPRRRALAALWIGAVLSGSPIALAALALSGSLTVLAAFVLSGSLTALAAPGDAGNPQPVKPVVGKTAALAIDPPTPLLSAPLEGFDPLVQRLEGAVLVSDLPEGRRAELTLEPGLQARLRTMLRDYAVPYGAVVAIEPATGRVLAYVSHSSANPAAGDLARDASAPSASVFKLVTAAALIDAGVGPETRVCFGGGGLRRLSLVDLLDNPRRDRACVTLERAIAGSINTVIARFADRNLDHATLERYAAAFGFGQAIPFDAPMEPSRAEVPEDRLEFARTAAGFWHMYMSPLHAAVLAATIANAGAMPRPAIVERVVDAQVHPLYAREPSPMRSVISPATAKTLGQMMLGTVAYGTARTAFHDARGRPSLPGIAVAGKTGSLSSDRPFRAYSWWVGYAPEAAPEIAVAVLIVNTAQWRIKASQVAREALHYYLIERKAPPRLWLRPPSLVSAAKPSAQAPPLPLSQLENESRARADAAP